MLEPLVNFNGKGKSVQMPPSCVSEILAEEYRDRLLFCESSQSFYAYDDTVGVWIPESDLVVRAKVSSELKNRGSEGTTVSYWKDIVESLRKDLYHKVLTPKAGLLPMKNGTLDLNSMELLPHQPGYRQVSALPYDFDLAATCPLTQAWLLEAQNDDPMRVERLRAVLRAIANGRTDLQKFFEIVGTVGTDKSTFVNLAIAMVGVENMVTTNLPMLEKSRFETANLKGKRLIVITDPGKNGGKTTVLRAITGGDPVRYEKRGKNPVSCFWVIGMVIICSNEPFHSTDHTSGLARRRVSTPFDKKPAEKDLRGLLEVDESGFSGELAPELPGVFNWVMEMSEQDMKSALENEWTHQIPSLKG